MRVSPIGFAFSTVETVMAEARKSAEVSHNHQEGIKGAQAVGKGRIYYENICRNLSRIMAGVKGLAIKEVRPWEISPGWKLSVG